MINTLLCEKCGDYGFDMIDGVCTVCLDGHKQAQPEPAKPTCAYCGKPATEQREIWENGGRVTKWFCSRKCASYYQMGAEG